MFYGAFVLYVINYQKSEMFDEFVGDLTREEVGTKFHSVLLFCIILDSLLAAFIYGKISSLNFFVFRNRFVVLQFL